MANKYCAITSMVDDIRLCALRELLEPFSATTSGSADERDNVRQVIFNTARRYFPFLKEYGWQKLYDADINKYVPLIADMIHREHGIAIDVENTTNRAAGNFMTLKLLLRLDYSKPIPDDMEQELRQVLHSTTMQHHYSINMLMFDTKMNPVKWSNSFVDGMLQTLVNARSSYPTRGIDLFPIGRYGEMFEILNSRNDCISRLYHSINRIARSWVKYTKANGITETTGGLHYVNGALRNSQALYDDIQRIVIDESEPAWVDVSSPASVTSSGPSDTGRLDNRTFWSNSVSTREEVLNNLRESRQILGAFSAQSFNVFN